MNTVPCGSCGKPIVFLKTTWDRWMPTDAHTVAERDHTFDRTRHTSHYATCPDAAKYRRKQNDADK